MAISITAEERTRLEELLATATEQRLALDSTLSEIESIVGQEVDCLDEDVGNGIDADTLLEMLEDEDGEEDE